MAYQLKAVTLRTDNTEVGMSIIDEVWQDIMSGKLPILFDSGHNFMEGISPVSKYHNYESDEKGAYDLSIMGVTADFFGVMEETVRAGQYKKYEEAGDDLGACAKAAWAKVWGEQEAGAIDRRYFEDYESTVPAAYTKDGKAHCYLYIGVK